MVFGYLGFLLVRGIVERNWWSIAVSVLIGILFGWTLGGILPTDQRISWQAHLFGLIGGVVAAVVFRRPREVPPGDLLGPIGIGGPAPTLPPE